MGAVKQAKPTLTHPKPCPNFFTPEIMLSFHVWRMLGTVSKN